MDAFIFVFGLVVTVVTFAAVGTIWWAALRDGQVDGEIEREERGEERDFNDHRARRAA